MSTYTSRLISIPAQNNSTWTQRTADISAYIGSTARLVILYQSGSSFTGDIQLDDFNIGGNSYTDFTSSSLGFETNAVVDNSQVASGNLDSIASEYPASWEAVGTTTSAYGKFVRDGFGTPSSSTGNTSGNTGSYYLYAETSSTGSNNDIWLRSPEVTLNNGTLEFYSAQNGATCGPIYAYLEIGSLAVTFTPSAVVGSTALSFFGGDGLIETTEAANTTNSGWGRGTWGEAGWNAAVPNPTTVSATTALGSVTVSGGATVAEDSVLGTSALGDVSSEQLLVVRPTSVTGTGQLTTPTILGNAAFSVTGLAGTTALGTVDAQSVAPTTGVSATGGIGSLTVTGTGVVVPTGQASTSALGTPTILLTQVITLSSLAATGAVNAPAILGDANFAVTGVSGTISLGTATPFAGADVDVTGRVGTTSLGTVTPFAGARPTPSGVSASISNSFTIVVKGNASLTLTGVSGTGAVSSPNVWSDVDPSVSQTWSNITPNPARTWSGVAA